MAMRSSASSDAASEAANRPCRSRSFTMRLIETALRNRRFGLQRGERRNIGIPLDERGHGPKAPQGFAVKRPHFGRDAGSVRIDEALTGRIETGEMNLCDCARRNPIQPGERVSAVIARVDVDVVD